ncbi:ABC transporter ATP-binding protein [Demequina sp. NBRC 110052]|uniref:ABC transporter ATP-binding protein n=1 Tax=Demequina sp. NBRC 110052 TaxID=1570341 RepID=UPI00117FE5EE|nr:ATP-binding cassette domain-containing protein [Demequina sp. NBRC 110052]
MSLDAHVLIRSRAVDARLTVERGRTLVLLGTNGAGKSTVLEAIAGIVPVDSGEIAIHGRALTGGGRRVPLASRRIALLSQDDALFPTMSVLDNVAFGPRSRGSSREEARHTARAWLERVGATDLAARRPTELSGGQARRVAIARALAPAPEAVLLDEPLARLDVEAATAIRALLQHVLRDVTAIVATHDALDAHALADDVAVIEAGVVVEAGTASEVLTRPRTAFAARMAARVLIRGTMQGGALVLVNGTRVPVAGGPRAGAAAGIAVRPTLIALALGDEPRVPGRAWVTDTVVALEPRGDEVRVHGSAAAADVDPAEASRIIVGERVLFGVPTGLPAYAI